MLQGSPKKNKNLMGWGRVSILFIKSYLQLENDVKGIKYVRDREAKEDLLQI